MGGSDGFIHTYKETTVVENDVMQPALNLAAVEHVHQKSLEKVKSGSQVES